MRDYARIYDLPTVVFRMSCIYGPRQLGNEDQGWLAHFIISAVTGRPITIFGNGKQVRDLLYVDDLVAALWAVVENVEVTRGQVYNMGGGPANSVSIWAKLGNTMTALTDERVTATYGTWRADGQPFYVSDIRKAQKDFQ